LAGYAVECALKACIIAHLNKSEEWPEPGFSNRCYKHSPETLLELTGLVAACDAEATSDSEFAINWNIVKDWTEEARYDHAIIDEAKAKAIYSAIAEQNHGVLQWLKKHW
jgi:hypothetical protein